MRYLNIDKNVVEKCSFCQDKVHDGELPQCVAQCGGRARFFGDLDEGLGSFKGAGKVGAQDDRSYDGVLTEFCTLDEVAKPFAEEDVHSFADEGNDPSFLYILRGHEWQATR